MWDPIMVIYITKKLFAFSIYEIESRISYIVDSNTPKYLKKFLM